MGLQDDPVEVFETIFFEEVDEVCLDQSFLSWWRSYP